MEARDQRTGKPLISGLIGIRTSLLVGVIHTQPTNGWMESRHGIRNVTRRGLSRGKPAEPWRYCFNDITGVCVGAAALFLHGTRGQELLPTSPPPDLDPPGGTKCQRAFVPREAGRLDSDSVFTVQGKPQRLGLGSRSPTCAEGEFSVWTNF